MFVFEDDKGWGLILCPIRFAKLLRPVEFVIYSVLFGIELVFDRWSIPRIEGYIKHNIKLDST